MPNIDGDTVNEIEEVLSQHNAFCDIEITSITDHRTGWLVCYSASDQDRAWLVAYLTKRSDLDGHYIVHWSELAI